MNILAIDTSTDVCSACIASDGQAVAEYATKSKRTHTERLMPAIDLLLSHAQIKMNDVGCLAVINGPGSFTGLRIGLSVIKGLAIALQCPVVAADALHMAALQVPASGWISPCMDARRNEIFTALYKKEGSVLETVIPPCSIRPEQWMNQLSQDPIHFCGPGAALYWSVLQKGESKLWFKDFVLAKTLAAYAAIQISEGRTMAAQDLRAAYLRPSDAEAKGPRPARKPERIPT